MQTFVNGHFRDDSEGKRVKRICAFYDERYGKNRSITDIDWSPKVADIFLARQFILTVLHSTQS